MFKKFYLNLYSRELSGGWHIVKLHYEWLSSISDIWENKKKLVIIIIFSLIVNLLWNKFMQNHIKFYVYEWLSQKFWIISYNAQRMKPLMRYDMILMHYLELKIL